MGEEAEARAPATGSRWRSARTYRRLGLLALVVAVAVASILLSTRLDITKQAGYPTVALLSFFSSASLFLPVPGLAVPCGAVGIAALSPVPVALLAATGMTLGELTGYLAGYSGRSVIGRGRTYQKMVEWTRRRGGWVLFVFAVIPNPFFDAAGMAAGALRYPVWRFLAVIWCGKLVKTLAVAYACAYSLQGVIRWFHLD